MIYVIGEIHNEDGTPIAGYHVNSDTDIPELAAYKVTPTMPYRVIGGVETHFYRFDSEQAWLDAAQEAGIEHTDSAEPIA
jgi:hypothetical protein